MSPLIVLITLIIEWTIFSKMSKMFTDELQRYIIENLGLSISKVMTSRHSLAMCTPPRSLKLCYCCILRQQLSHPHLHARKVLRTKGTIQCLTFGVSFRAESTHASERGDLYMCVSNSKNAATGQAYSTKS